MSFRNLPISTLKEWQFCHCTLKFWGREFPKTQNLIQFDNKKKEDFVKLLQIKDPIVTDELTIIMNNFNQKTTLMVDNDFFLMGSVDSIILNKNRNTFYIFNIRQVKNIPKYAYKSDKYLLIIYNLLLFRFLHRKEKSYQIKIGFEFLENYHSLLQALSSFRIGNPCLGYTTNKQEFLEELISNPRDFFKKYKDQIFYITFNLKNIKNSFDQLEEMISECTESQYIERNHNNLKKCQNCYYNKIFSCENSLI